MKQATLTDTITGKVHDLTALVKEHEEVSIGKLGKGAVIELGVRDPVPLLVGVPSDRGKKILEAVRDLKTVSRRHATITYRNGSRDRAYVGQGFYIKDSSINGTRVGICGNPVFWGDIALGQRAELYFGRYGPVIFEEILEKWEANSLSQRL